MKTPSMTFILLLIFGSIADNARAQVAVGSSPKCVLKEWDKTTEKWKEVWAGAIPPEYEIKHQPWTLIAWQGGSLDISSNDWKTLKKIHDGRTTIHLLKFNGQVQISIGHIDSSNVKNHVPTDAVAWASDDSKEIGVGAFQKRLECKLR